MNVILKKAMIYLVYSFQDLGANGDTFMITSFAVF